MPHHALDPDEPRARPAADPWTRLVETVRRAGSLVGPVISLGWPWFGRAVLVTLVVVIVLCRVTGTTQAALTEDGGGPFLAQVAMVLSFAVGILAPYILLPHSFAGAARRRGDLLIGRTVLGTRRIDLRSSRAYRWSIPSRTGTVDFVTLIGRPSGVLIVGSTGTISSDLDLEDLIRADEIPEPAPRHIGARVVRILLRLVVPSILTLAFSFAVIFVSALAALGA